MSMNLSEDEIKAWWNEFENELSKMTIPCVPMPPTRLEDTPRKPKWVEGNVYYTLQNDKQFAVDSNHPRAKGWAYE